MEEFGGGLHLFCCLGRRGWKRYWVVPESLVHHLCWVPIRLKHLPRWFFSPINLETGAKNLCYGTFQSGHTWTVSVKTTVGCTTVGREYRVLCSHSTIVFLLRNKTSTGYATCIISHSQTTSCLHFCVAQEAGRGLRYFPGVGVSFP